MLIDLDVNDPSAWWRFKVVFQFTMLAVMKLTVVGHIIIIIFIIIITIIIFYLYI